LAANRKYLRARRHSARARRSGGLCVSVRCGANPLAHVEAQPILLSQRHLACAKRPLITCDLRMANLVEDAPEVLVALDVLLRHLTLRTAVASSSSSP
jgi:hypothetical protein